MTKSRGILPPRKQWREDESAALCARYADEPAAELAERGQQKPRLVQK